MARASVGERSSLRFLPLACYVSNPRGILAWPGLPGVHGEEAPGPLLEKLLAFLRPG